MLDQFLARLKVSLPESWRISVLDRETLVHGARLDALIELTAPDGARARIIVERKSRMSAAQASDLGPRLRSFVDEGRGDGAVVFTRFVSRLARERLRLAGVSYLDLTGNTWIRLERPAVLIETHGADRDPEPSRPGVRSLKGPKAARLVRALCDWRPPVGVRELARRAGVDAGYATRVLKLLADEDIVQRNKRREVVEVRWQDLLRRWAQDYSVRGTNRSVSYLAPRGLPWLRERLASISGRYAVTGAAAVPPEAQTGAAPLLTCYVDEPETRAEELDLRSAEIGANVLLLEPFDPVAYERTRIAAGLVLVAVSQCAVDLLTGSGREPAQAESLMTWLAENEHAWRA